MGTLLLYRYVDVLAEINAYYYCTRTTGVDM